jgi:predicted secreted protein
MTAEKHKPQKRDNFTLNLKENPITGHSCQLNLSKGRSILSDYYNQNPAIQTKWMFSRNSFMDNACHTQGNQQVTGIFKRSVTQPARRRYLHLLLRSAERHFSFSDPLPFLIQYSASMGLS